MGIGELFNNRNQSSTAYNSPRDIDSIKEKLLAGLNPEQREVVLHDKGPLLVGAIAGSGKTHALIRRVGYLITVRGIHPGHILAVTFSKKGADEMQTRLNTLIGQNDARIGTFHSLALEILRSVTKYKDPDYNLWKIDDRGRYRFCLKDATGFKELDWQAADINILDSFVSLCKCNMARPNSEMARTIAKSINLKNRKESTNPEQMLMAYERAEELREQRQLLGFDDMLMEATEFLVNNENIRREWASKYEYVLQDEAQDQNLCQLLMGEYLAKDHRNYMLVGDPSQTIFTWRGAKPEKLLGFEKKWNAKLITMNRNYRCGSTIIDAANNALNAMDPSTRLDMNMVCERNTVGSVKYAEYRNLDEEGSQIVEQIQNLIVDGAKPKDFVILYRTNAQSRAPEEALISARIPYQIIGGANFYERKEVKNLLAYLRLVDGRGDLEDIARAINTPFRYLGKAFLDRIREVAKENKIHKGKSEQSWSMVIRNVCNQQKIQRRQKENAIEWSSLLEELKFRIEKAQNAHETDLEAKREGSPAHILDTIVRRTRYQEWLQKDEGEETPENSRVSNVREMIRAAERFNDIGELLDYVDDTLKASKKQRKSNGEQPNKVTLCSLHRSKGLEWPYVFVSGVCEKVLPHGRCEDIEEERRLFYVGVTRAREGLSLSSVRNVAFGKRVMPVEPSRFLQEAGLNILENDTFEDDLPY